MHLHQNPSISIRRRCHCTVPNQRMDVELITILIHNKAKGFICKINVKFRYNGQLITKCISPRMHHCKVFQRNS